MDDATSTTVRAAMTTRALSTLGACPQWDRAVCEFLRLQALSHSNDEFGPFADANEAFDWVRLNVESKYGRSWREVPQAAEEMKAAHAAIRQAEEQQADEYLRPLWAAHRALALTPAPTFNAALFKSELMAWEEIWNDNRLERNGFEIVVEELARFAEGSA